MFPSDFAARRLTRALLSACIGLLSVTNVASATEPLSDLLEITENGRLSRVRINQWGHYAIEMPVNATLREMKRKEIGGCTARFGPLGIWRIKDEQVMLVGFHKCGGDFPLSEVYPGQNEPLVATWLNGKLSYETGPDLCWGGWRPLQARTRILTVEQGRVTATEELDNLNRIVTLSSQSAVGGLPRCEFIRVKPAPSVSP
jgi:hypothetical protein